MEHIEELKKGNKILRIYRDENPIEPEDEGIILVHYHRDFYKTSEEITEEEVKSFYYGEKIKQEKEYFIFKVTALIHSGIWLSLNSYFNEDPQGWDTSHVGLILIDKKLSKNKKRAFKIAGNFIEWYNQYLMGDVYGFKLIKINKPKYCKCCKQQTNETEEEINSCWGFFGDDGLNEIKTQNGFKLNSPNIK